jgi:hypothetical protein
VPEFFAYLRHERGLREETVAHYGPRARSARRDVWSRTGHGRGRSRLRFG